MKEHIYLDLGGRIEDFGVIVGGFFGWLRNLYRGRMGFDNWKLVRIMLEVSYLNYYGFVLDFNLPK